jgi:hypothetical protein
VPREVEDVSGIPFKSLPITHRSIVTTMSIRSR